MGQTYGALRKHQVLFAIQVKLDQTGKLLLLFGRQWTLYPLWGNPRKCGAIGGKL